MIAFVCAVRFSEYEVISVENSTDTTSGSSGTSEFCAVGIQCVCVCVCVYMYIYIYIYIYV